MVRAWCGKDRLTTWKVSRPVLRSVLGPMGRGGYGGGGSGGGGRGGFPVAVAVAEDSSEQGTGSVLIRE